MQQFFFPSTAHFAASMVCFDVQNKGFCPRTFCKWCQDKEDPNGGGAKKKGAWGGKGGGGGGGGDKCGGHKPNWGQGKHQDNFSKDWICFGCGNVNWADKEACNKCQIKKTTWLPKNGMHPGDWICRNCDNFNYTDVANCMKCQARAPKLETRHRMRIGDWQCKGCQNVNYSYRTECHKCGAEKGEF